jgi:hypothetical protein
MVMRSKLNCLGLALAISFTFSGVAQTAHSIKQGDLELRLQPEDVRMNVPKAFTFLIVNRSDHEVRLPMPAIERGDAPHGTIWLRLNFVPSRPGTTPSQLLGGGVNDYTYQPILDRVRTWKVLRPGESLSLGTINDRVIAGEAGTYDYWAYYYPPGMPKADEEVLQKAGIDFPKAELESTHVKFVKKQ